MKELVIFDFDGTLFKSPDRPTWFKGSWFTSELSLNYPCVPAVPGSDWWMSSIVQDARKAIGNPNQYAVLATGRLVFKADYRWRIPELLGQAGLNFDEVHLNTGAQTSTFKAQLAYNLIQEHGFTSVKAYDDKHENLAAIGKVCHALDVAFTPIDVAGKSHPVDCSPEKVRNLVFKGELPPEVLKHLIK